MIKPYSEEYPTGIFTSTFTGNEAFLADHVIQGRKVLPGMAYLEMARAAVAASVSMDDEYLIRLSDSVFIQPLIVVDECSVDVKIYPGRKGEFGIEVITGQGVHFQSKATIEVRPEQMPASLDIAALTEQCMVAGPDKTEFYASFKKLGVDYGPSHQGIREIRIGETCVLASLFLPGSSRRGMDLDPGMLDSVIQSGAVMASDQDKVSVPFAIKSVTIYGPLTDTAYACLVQSEQGQGFDYTVADEAGAVKVIINGFVARELSFAGKDDLVFYQPQWQDDAPAEGDEDSEAVTVIEEQSSYEKLVKAVFKTAQKLIQDKVDKHTLEVHLPVDKPAWHGIIGLLKTIRIEYPKISCKLKIGERYRKLSYSAVDVSVTDGVDVWADNKTILITGGMGGLGRLFTEDIVRKSKGCTLILVGRSELDDSKKETLKDLEADGATVVYEPCDISKKSAVTALIEKYPQINGVIHGSGVIRDNYIANKTMGEIDQVLAPKVKGLDYLDQATAELKLDYFMVFSSMAGTLGNAGQADYSAANAYMDAYIHHRAAQVEKKERHGKSISINWPLWESEGMQVDEAIRQNMLQVFKIKPLPAEYGLQVLRQMLAFDYPQMLVLFGNPGAITTLFERMNSERKQAPRKTVVVESDKLIREILQEIKIKAGEQLKMEPDQFDEEADWSDFGFDSILLSSFVNEFNAEFNLELMPTALFEATNMQLLSEHLAENYADQMAQKLGLEGTPAVELSTGEPEVREPDMQKISAFAQSFKKAYKSSVAYRDEDVAIVGISCRIAGARNPEEFWQMLIDERDMITEIPSDRWNWQAYPESAKWGSFIDGVAEFDPLFFSISPAEARYMAPEQRLLMQSVWECLEHAGCSGDATKGTDTGIFVGIGPSGYSQLLRGMPVEAYSSTGMVPSVGPNRISYLMDWNGPSEPIETACSSSLVAVHRAVEAIRAGHCSQAIAGGVNLLLTSESYISFTKAGMLCEDGRCKTFSDKANGYVRGEGIGIILLKPLKAAIRDGNVIHALVKGTAENHGGRTNSLTAPNPKSQSAVIRKALADADMDFGRVSYIECHGTGTELGDPVEIEGLKTVAMQLADSGSTQVCKLGSIKSNIGHLEMAAGVVGLIKVVLQMQHQKIVKSLHCEQLNPYIDLKNTPFEVAQAASDWEVEPGQTRVAGVSSFGFGGVNSHVIIEEFKAPVPAEDEAEESGPDGQSQLLILSARTEQSLIDYVAQYPSFIKTLPRQSNTLRRVAYTLQMGRSEMQERVVFIAKSLDEWGKQLDAFLEEKGKVKSRNVYRGTVKSSGSDNLEIGDTAAGRDYIQRLIDTQEHGKLAELWVKGSKIDWQALYASSNVQR